MGMLLGLSGSLRAGSFNRKLLRLSADVYGADTFVEADLRFPLFDGDLQEAEGIPASVQLLADQIAQAEAVVIATPEYNGALSGVLKNALDWVSRVEGNPWLDKPVAVQSATGGRSGGALAQASLRAVMTPFAARVLSGRDVMVAQAWGEFDADGQLKNERYEAALQKQMAALKALVV